MDSSDLLRSTSTLIPSKRGRKRKASEKNQTKRVKFYSIYQRQEFSLPDSIMFYIAQNPTSPELYQKMVQTCKYFFVKNSVLLVSKFSYFDDLKWKLFFNIRPIDLSKITSKLWITDLLYVESGNSVKNNFLSSLMPKLYQCDAKFVTFYNQIISFNDLSLLISAAERISFKNVAIKDKNGTNVGIEKIVEVAVKGKDITFRSNKNLLNITSETMKELIKLPHFLKIDDLTISPIPEAFDLESFYYYMKKNKTTKFWLRFNDSISETYRNRLIEIVDEIRATKTFDYKRPFIFFA